MKTTNPGTLQVLFRQATYRGDVKEVKSLLNEGVDVNLAGEHGRTPIHLAAWGNHLEIL